MKILIDVLFYLAVCSTVIALLLQSWPAFTLLGMASALVGIAMIRRPGS